MKKRERKKLMKVFFVLLMLFLLNEMLILKLDKKNSWFFKLQKEIKYAPSINRGLGYYESKDRLLKMKFDEYWIYTEVNQKLERKSEIPEQLKERFLYDPNKRLLDRNNPVLNIKFEKKRA